MTQASTIICTGCKSSYAEAALYCPNCGRPKLREQTTDPLIGKLLGERFEIAELIGQGASGTIYRAEHVTLRRRVAIKVLHNELSRDDLAVERFRREATTVAEIDNEHIVEIHDFGRTPDGRLYLAMELLEGETLDATLARERTLSVERAADILIQVGEALMEAHAIGYVHRDLRPRNVYLAVRRGKANFVKLLDFGLAKLVETDAQAASTSLGMTFGDPRYMSPEQARGDRIDRRADIYQLGCVAYEMLTGQPPFVGNRVFDILTKQVTEIPAPLPTRRPGVPLWMEAAVAKMLAKDPENRFATTTRMVEALRRGLETGEVMEDEIARRRESIPPPSVSRMMQKMGMSSPADSPREHARDLPPLEPAPPAADPPATKSTVLGHHVEPGQLPQLPGVKATMHGHHGEPVERRRTGTPEVGVPVVAPPPQAFPPPIAPAGSQFGPPMMPPVTAAPEVQPPVTGVIEQPAGRGKRAPSEASTDSASWFDDGDAASAEAERVRARKLISPSTTDMSLYDEPARRGKLPLLLGIGAFVVIGGAIAFALTRGGSDKKTTPPPAVAQNQTTPADAAPANVIETPDATVAVAAAPDAAVVAAKTNPPPTHETHETHATPPNANSHDHDRKGGLDDFNFGKTDRPPTNTTPPPPPPPPPNNPGKGSAGVSGADGPQDPYNTASDPTADPGDGAAPEKKAEFYANVGAQQLSNGDTAGAAANFKKASELDPKNVTAVSGMGEIALRQGLFGDAIAHLKKAARLAPKSSKVFTLLGEAFLGAGQNAQAAENFKKALQLDPDNTRARDGYNEASSKVPPPSDDN